MKYCFLLLTFLPALIACKGKKKEPEKKYVSILSLIKSQVAHVDTSLYPIMRLDIKDSLHTDTTHIRREQFRQEAKDFLAIPDLSDKNVAGRFKEETLYDESINRVTITYTPVNPAAEEVLKQEMSVTPNPVSGDKVNSVFIIREISNRDSFVRKNLLWQMDKSFKIITIRQVPGQPETTSTIKVTWNEDQY